MPAEIVDLNDFKAAEWPSTPAGEERQAREVVLHYKTLMSRPAVQGITWWDLSDGGWLNAPAGLLRMDHTPKPAYDELLKLIKGEWWVKSTTVKTDAEGGFSFSGFAGDYEATAEGKTARFTLKEGGKNDIILEL